MSKISQLSLISFIVIKTTLNFPEGYNVANALVQSFPQNSKVAPVGSVYIPANKNPILKLDGNLNFLKTYPKKDRNTLLYWF